MVIVARRTAPELLSVHFTRSFLPLPLILQDRSFALASVTLVRPPPLPPPGGGVVPPPPPVGGGPPPGGGGPPPPPPGGGGQPFCVPTTVGQASALFGTPSPSVSGRHE